MFSQEHVVAKVVDGEVVIAVVKLVHRYRLWEDTVTYICAVTRDINAYISRAGCCGTPGIYPPAEYIMGLVLNGYCMSVCIGERGVIPVGIICC